MRPRDPATPPSTARCSMTASAASRSRSGIGVDLRSSGSSVAGNPIAATASRAASSDVQRAVSGRGRPCAANADATSRRSPVAAMPAQSAGTPSALHVASTARAICRDGWRSTTICGTGNGRPVGDGNIEPTGSGSSAGGKSAETMPASASAAMSAFSSTRPRAQSTPTVAIVNPLSAVSSSFPSISGPYLFAPVFPLLGGETDGDRLDRQDFQIDPTVGAGDDLALLDSAQFPFGAAFGTGRFHCFSSVSCLSLVRFDFLAAEPGPCRLPQHALATPSSTAAPPCAYAAGSRLARTRSTAVRRLPPLPPPYLAASAGSA